MAATGTQVGFEQVGDSDSISQLIRSNAPQYWSYMKRHADLRALKPYLSFEGAGAGDPHLGNFAPLPVTTNTGSREMRFVDVDFDDAGRAPFVLDYIRYLAALKAQCKPLNSRTIQEAYLLGLAGKKIAAPKKIKRLLAMSVRDYDKLAAAYVAKHCTEQAFRFKCGEIEEYSGAIKPATIKKLFPGEDLLSLAHRMEARGGSANEARIWVLVDGNGSRRRIVELKQYATPGTASYRPQPAVKQWLAEIRQAFWPGLSGAEYDLITLGNAGLFWIREKRVSLIDVPYSSRKKEDIKFVIDLAIHDANLLGLAHGSQEQSQGYVAAIHKDTAKFHRVTKAVERTYLKAARKAFKEGRRLNRHPK
jgi:hypothetical protein